MNKNDTYVFFALFAFLGLMFISLAFTARAQVELQLRCIEARGTWTEKGCVIK
ncbi:hypothetical protein UFOVP398_60 [uncultured Caudovirales phage]|uniref:Uncharacterized protein n=1 Tax=uncultured Caudovirales phage TaxID=2100421 RepID=A0A6J5M390_9CAUD|nr:hypothetical protein UFOVP398_60 [uncultured Caudovirales phage]